MPEKSYRDMSKLERLHYSLESKTFHTTILGAIILGGISLLIGLSLYAYALGGQYIGEAFNLTKYSGASLSKLIEVEPLAREVMEIYNGLSPEEKAKSGEASYQQHFAGVTSSAAYQTTMEVLKVFLESSDVRNLYIAMYDEEASSLVMIADADLNHPLLPGQTEAISKKSIERFKTWDGKNRKYVIQRLDNIGWLATSGIPLKNQQGETYAYIFSDVTLGNVGLGMRGFLIQFVGATFIVVNLLAFFLTRHMKKTLVMPINAISSAAESYIQDRMAGKTDTSHFEDLKISTGDEVEKLALIMGDMEKELQEYEANLTSVIAEKERIGTELALATRIQADMLPNVFPPYPERKEFDIFASMNPAKEVGGDFYDFFLVDDAHLALVMADVSGKGVPAALFMMVSKILVQNAVLNGKSPKEALEYVNDQICANNQEEMFVTVWLGILNLQTGLLRAANAGHEFPIIMQPGGDFEVLKDKHGFVVGGMPGVSYKEYEVKLQPGAKIFVYTDGVVEATNASDELFGMDRTLEAVRSAEGSNPQNILHSVNDAVEGFVLDAPQFDDLTMLCLHYIGGAKKQVKSITVDAKIENIEKVTDFINEELEAHDCSMKSQMQIDVAVDELFGNIAQYAYDGLEGEATVEVDVDDDKREVAITFIDRGTPYNPLEKADPDTTLSAEEREIGGLGIFLVKKTMDEVTYSFENQENHLTIRKKL